MNQVSWGAVHVVLLVLALIWALALLPPLIRSRLEGNPVDSVGRFRRHLRVLESATPAASSLASDPVLVAGGWAPRSMPKAWADEARRLRRLRRRQQVARSLLAVMGSTLVIGIIPGFHAVLALHVLADLLFAGYVFMLIQARNLEAERQMRAHFEAVQGGSHNGEEVDTAVGAMRRQAFS